MSLANQFSYLIISSIAIAVVLIVLRFGLRSRWRTLGIAALALAVVAGGLFVVLRPGSSDVDSVEAAEAILSNGQPTLIEFFSNYCAGCMGVRPAVETLVSDLRSEYADAFNILRVDIHTPFGRELRERYGFSFTPEFVLFNGQGEELWRSHAPPEVSDVQRLLVERG